MGNGSAGGFGLLTGSVLAVLAAGGPLQAAECAPDVVTLKGAGAEARFSVELADEPAEQALGLMNREKMASSKGMLFIFPEPKHARFWMKDTLIPLDMVFLDQTGTVTVVQENARPLDEGIYDGGVGVKYVLEINGGLAAALGLGPGAVMRHPSVDPALAAWPCTD